MGDDEAAALFISLAITAAVLWIWYVPLFCVHRMFRSGIMRFLLAVLPPACAVIVWRTLLMPADPQVARDCDYLMLFVFAGVAWLIVPIVALPLLGISARADAVERNNWPAMIVALAATVSTTLVYAASNVGRGPTIWTTFGPATLGTVAMIFLWFIHRLLSPAWEDVAVGRDLSAGFRLGGMMLAVATIIAAPLAGDWVSASATLRDFGTRAWPALLVIAAGASLDRLCKPTPARIHPPAFRLGFAIAAVQVSLAAIIAAIVQ